MLCDFHQLPDEADLKRLGVKDLWVERIPMGIDPKRLRALGPRLTQIDNRPAAEFLKQFDK